MRTYDLHETIAAIASAPGGAARGMVRVSGPDALRCAERLLAGLEGRRLSDMSQPGVVDGSMKLEGFATAVDCRLYVWPTRRSYTREPLVEIHTVGSRPVLEAVLAAVLAAGARVAEPGEFTLRSFLAGRVDLTQAEAVLGVIDAKNHGQLETALSQLAGGVWKPLHYLRERLLDLLAHLEAGLDFADEDIEFISAGELVTQIDQARETVSHVAAQMESRAVAPTHVRAVLVGSPNVGKSSLFNALLGTAAAITSPRPGTTRDYLTTRLELDGVAIELVDTAGLDAEGLAGQIERAAQAMTGRQRDEALIELFCIDSTRPLRDEEKRLLTAEPHGARIVVLTKSDSSRQTDYAGPDVATSVVTGEGLDVLVERLRQTADSDSAVVASTAQRCRDGLRLAADSLQRARSLVDGPTEELIAAEIRVALDEIGQTIGAVYTNDVLDRIFSRFCIGK